jgi:hypothetical protein
MRLLLIVILITAGFSVFAQYPPAAGQDGSSAIYADSTICTGWASSCTLMRGWADISDTTLGRTDFGTEADATGKADNNPVSLGDGGTAILTFDSPITNGPGPDFAVFENGFSDNFLELAFVEVSSDGQYYVRFPSVSLTDTDTQVAGFGTLDPTRIHNLAGKYRAMFGCPFDLDDLPDDPMLDKSRITHVRITDVVGSVLPDFATYDSQGNIINDPWPTPFNTGGFDLDAVAIVSCNCQITKPSPEANISVYPNPAETFINISTGNRESFTAEILRITGSSAGIYNGKGIIAVDISGLEKGIYIIYITSDTERKSEIFIKK